MKRDLVDFLLSEYNPGYMGDWLLNAARRLNLDNASLNVFTETFSPNDLNIRPLALNAETLKAIIERELKSRSPLRNYLKMPTNWYHITTGQFGYPQPEKDFGYIDKTYDSSKACLTCHMGLSQKDEFRFRSEPKAKHSQFLGLHWVFDQIFVRQTVKDTFEQERISGIKFSQPVINKTGALIEGIYQLRVDNLISNGLLTDNLRTEVCERPKDKSWLNS